MKENITHLQEVNRDLNAKLSRFRDMEEVTVNQIDSPLEKVQRLSAKLQEKDQELERKIDKILALDEQLNAEARFQTILDDMKCDFTFSRKFSEGLAELEEGSRQLAIIVGQCLSNKRVKNLRKKPRRQPELSKFITDTIGQIGQLVSNPTSCIRALIFGFVRERIFFSDCWTALHYDGYMLRELQDVIQKMCPQNTLESLHKAAIESMLSRDTGFEQCWIKAEVEDNQHQFLELLSPLFDHQELEDMRHQIERDLRVLFTGAFKTRSRLFAPTGFRFQLVQFKPGVEFDPEYMRVQRESATVSKSPDNKLHRVKACIHGCLLKYSEQEEPLTLDTDVIKRLSQPLGRSETSQPTGSGTLMSDKAIVILED
ncbi:hypothetical protein N7456_012014 [Penicillium angulare]|uniref:Uncharacterized protein n=1 Tax=Penicillium angulare TaxID=116970 RepID=A0A9W9EUQ8_9EURO|nr:hypothetical protein N7456_012014 [Penicillium angulare]